MRHYQVIIVGGGPAGAAAAERLVREGVKCAVLDRAVFPRQKTCAGWITPGVLASLGIQPGDYPYQLTRFPSLKVYLGPLGLRRAGVQYAIRRIEFDDWLLRRSGAEVIHHNVYHIKMTPSGYEIDDLFSADHLVGAGGNNCPVFRQFFSADHPRGGAKILALECEYQWNGVDGDCRLWFFRNRLPGYAWFVPKKGGMLNIGVGGNAQALEARGSTIQEHWDYLLALLRKLGLIEVEPPPPHGYSYYLRGEIQQVQLGNVYLAGDAAGLATLDMGEGIGPAIRSGQLAAEAILGRRTYALESISRYSLLPKPLRCLLR
jgi:flavin-dependent dehydrogenase